MSSNTLTDQQLDDFEQLYNIKIEPDHRELLKTEKNALDGRESERQYLLTLALAPMQCAGCLKTTCLYATALHRGHNGHGNNDDDYECNFCHASLHMSVMLIGGAHMFSLQPGQTVIVPDQEPQQ